MSKCPYTWFVSLFTSSGSSTSKDQNQPAEHLRVTVVKGGERVVDVALPSRSARWLIDLIPSDVMTKIRAEAIPIDDIQKELAHRETLFPQSIFTLKEEERQVEVWLE